MFTSDDKESHRVFSSVLSFSWPATPTLPPAAPCQHLDLSLAPFRPFSLPLLSHLCCGCALARGLAMTRRELQMGAWERTPRRAVGVFWAAPAFSCLFLPRRVVSEHFFAAPGFSSHLVNLRPSKKWGWVGVVREEMRQMWMSD